MKRVEDVYGRGWDRLKSMRKKGDAHGVGCFWMLDEQLADFVGAKTERLEKKARENLQSAWSRYLDHAQDRQGPKEKELELRIIGTAVALAFLDVVFHDCRTDWQGSIGDEGHEALRKMEKQLGVESSYDAVRSMLTDLGVATNHVEGSHLRKD
eukprot:gene56779-biopygen98919